MTSNPSSSRTWPCRVAPTSAGHVWKRGRNLACAQSGEPSHLRVPSARPLPAPATTTRRGASATRRRGPGVGARVPSSATVAAQPDSRNLLARGHLWASGKSLSSSSGTDIQQQDRTTMQPFWPAPRAAAGLPPCQGGPSSTDEWRGGHHVPPSARPGRPANPQPS